MIDTAVVSTALLYAAPVLVVGFATGKGWLVMLTAVLVAVLGLAFGDPLYLLADLAAVLIVLVAALLRGRRHRTLRKARSGHDGTAEQSGSRRWAWLWDILGVLVVGWILFQTWKIDPPPAAASASAERSALQNAGTQARHHGADRTTRLRAIGLPRDADLRHCLEAGSPDAVRACAEKK